MRLPTRLLLDRLAKLEERVEQQDQAIGELQSLVGDLARENERPQALWKDGT